MYCITLYDFFLFSHFFFCIFQWSFFSDLASLFISPVPTSPPLQLNDEVFEDPGNACDACLQRKSSE